MTNIFGHSIRSELLFLYVAETFAGFFAVLGILVLGLLQGPVVDSRGAVFFAATLTLCFSLVSGVSGLYQPGALSRAGRFLACGGISALLLLALGWGILRVLGPVISTEASWGNLAEILVVFAAAIAVTRLGFTAVARSGLLRRRLLLVRGPNAAPPVEREIAGETRLAPFEVAGTVCSEDALVAALEAARSCARLPWAVVVADRQIPLARVRQRCAYLGVRVLDEDEFREQRLNRIDVTRLPEDWLAGARGVVEHRAPAIVRRTLDLVLSLSLVLFTLPLLLVVALAIKLDSPGPVFYRQERVGLGGRVFTLLKFRSMSMEAESGGAPVWATRRDPRVTRVGRLIRLTRIDEIPQVLNVLRGDMAFVGPRPERPVFVGQLGSLIPHYNDRAVVKPGITGWAQVNYPYGASVEDARMKLSYDLYYVRRRSLFLDLLILVATARVMLFQEGAR